jgi:hypothetical protein
VDFLFFSFLWVMKSKTKRIFKKLDQSSSGKSIAHGIDSCFLQIVFIINLGW